MVTFIISKIVVAVKMTNIFIFESFIVFMILLIVYLFRAALSSIVFFVDDGDSSGAILNLWESVA